MQKRQDGVLARVNVTLACKYLSTDVSQLDLKEAGGPHVGLVTIGCVCPEKKTTISSLRLPECLLTVCTFSQFVELQDTVFVLCI